jgi:predicted nuclease with TOPRIM domain
MNSNQEIIDLYMKLNEKYHQIEDKLDQCYKDILSEDSYHHRLENVWYDENGVYRDPLSEFKEEYRLLEKEQNQIFDEIEKFRNIYLENGVLVQK